MTREAAEALADYMEAHHACFHVHMIANGVGLLRERNLPIPAWTIPNESWVVLWRHDGSQGVEVMTLRGDWQIEQAIRDAGYIHADSDASPRGASGDGWVDVNKWVCPEHEQEDGAA